MIDRLLKVDGVDAQCRDKVRCAPSSYIHSRIIVISMLKMFVVVWSRDDYVGVSINICTSVVKHSRITSSKIACRSFEC